jgi:hypothetical protein
VLEDFGGCRAARVNLQLDTDTFCKVLTLITLPRLSDWRGAGGS